MKVTSERQSSTCVHDGRVSNRLELDVPTVFSSFELDGHEVGATIDAEEIDTATSSPPSRQTPPQSPKHLER
jgi:hypothetical protein